jgi:hypothetical protein
MPLEFEDAKPDDEIYKDDRIAVVSKPEVRPRREFETVMSEEEIEAEAKRAEEIRANGKR